MPFEIGRKGVPVPGCSPSGRGTARSVSLGYRSAPSLIRAMSSDLNEAAFAALQGVKVWIVDALRYRHASRPTQMLPPLSAWIERVKPERAILTNLHHDLDYEELRAQLPEGRRAGL